MASALPVEDWVAWLRDVRNLRSSSLDQYGTVLRAFQEFVDIDLEWVDIDAPTVEAFMQRPRRGGRTPAAATQSRDRVIIGTFFKWMEGRRQVESNPVLNVGVPRVDNRMPRAIPDQLWSGLWLSDLPDDDRVWLGLGAFAGLRRREIVSLAPEQVDARRGLLMYLSRKGGFEDVVEYAEAARLLGAKMPRFLPDPEGWLELIERFAYKRMGSRCLITMDTPTTALTLMRSSFDDPLLPAPAVLNKRLQRLLVGAGLPERAFSPHALRHTCASNMLRVGVPIEVVADYLGHSSIETTRRYALTGGRLAEWRLRD
jgi:integrase/recombinase XerD